MYNVADLQHVLFIELFVCVCVYMCTDVSVTIGKEYQV